eukprot:4033338-Pyramimonas_sp.AAC.2
MMNSLGRDTSVAIIRRAVNCASTKVCSTRLHQEEETQDFKTKDCITWLSPSYSIHSLTPVLEWVTPFDRSKSPVLQIHKGRRQCVFRPSLAPWSASRKRAAHVLRAREPLVQQVHS